ncbi:MAG: hypothetical protein M1604_02925 [Patescibacteria group bacterium]|nr:hypothetical protein [Patescibacteria group bacterium]
MKISVAPMPKNFWENINYEIIEGLSKGSYSKYKNGDHIGAALIEAALLDGSLRFSLIEEFKRDGKVKDNDFLKLSEEDNFYHLIKFFLAYTKDKKNYRKLDSVRKNRNKLIHNIPYFKSLEELDNHARSLYEEIAEVHSHLFHDYLSLRPEELEEKIRQITRGVGAAVHFQKIKSPEAVIALFRCDKSKFDNIEKGLRRKALAGWRYEIHTKKTGNDDYQIDFSNLYGYAYGKI